MNPFTLKCQIHYIDLLHNYFRNEHCLELEKIIEISSRPRTSVFVLVKPLKIQTNSASIHHPSEWPRRPRQCQLPSSPQPEGTVPQLLAESRPPLGVE